jgi:hypothetical protein
MSALSLSLSYRPLAVLGQFPRISQMSSNYFWFLRPFLHLRNILKPLGGSVRFTSGSPGERVHADAP